jgi:hypothetical protein
MAETGKRELIDTGSDQQFVRRDENGRFVARDDGQDDEQDVAPASRARGRG